MIRVCAAADFLREEHRKRLTETAEELGCEIRIFSSDEEASGKVADCEVAYLDDPALIPEMPGLKWCHTPFAGIDHFVRSGAFDGREIILTNSSGAYGLAISEYIIMMALTLMRRMPEYRQIMEACEWKQDLQIRSIEGSRIAIIGTGDLGSNAARRFRALGAASVTGFSRSGRPKPDFDEVYKMDDFESVIGAPGAPVDVLVLCAPGTAETAGILSRERIALLPASAYVINVGRGSLIDQDALIEALNAGRLAGAALDVMTPEPLPAGHPLRAARGCVLTPHISGDTGLMHSIDVTIDIFCENLARYVRGENLINIADIRAGY